MEIPDKIRIYSFYYKDTVVPVSHSPYVPVMAGSALYVSKLNMQGDDTGDSISHKNRWYSELTGIYWVWKNTSQAVTGCCHYRRYFTAKMEPPGYRLKRMGYFLAGLYKKRYGLIYTANLAKFNDKVITEYEIRNILEDYDAILPVKRKLRYTVKDHYKRYHCAEDLILLKQVIQENYPEYLPAFDAVMDDNRLYANNMFVLPEKHFNEFMTWWFSLLFSFEQKTDPDKYAGYQQRIMGFVAERLLTVWFYHKKLKVKELPVIYYKKIKHKN